MTTRSRTPWILALAGLATTMLFGGCEILDTKVTEPVRVITVHDIIRYPRGMRDLEKQIPTFSGQRIWINANPYLHSKSIESVELVPNAEQPEFYDLKLKLNSHGALVWMQLSVGLARQSLAFVIDGVYYRSFIIEQISDEKTKEVVIRGPFDRITAEALKENANANYRYYNGDDALSKFELMEDEQ